MEVVIRSTPITIVAITVIWIDDGWTMDAGWTMDGGLAGGQREQIGKASGQGWGSVKQAYLSMLLGTKIMIVIILLD